MGVHSTEVVGPSREVPCMCDVTHGPDNHCGLTDITPRRKRGTAVSGVDVHCVKLDYPADPRIRRPAGTTDAREAGCR